MKIGIIGYGYIGAVCSAALLSKGYEILIFDKNPLQTKGILNKNFSFPEKDVQDLINQNIERIGVVEVSDDFIQTDLIIVCVNTSLQANGRLDFSNILNVLYNLNNARYSGKVIIRSTLPLVEELISELERNYSFELYVLPEFLREGSALADLVGSKNTVIGYQNEAKMDDQIVALFSFEETKVHAMPIKEAIFTKLLNNTWHALKVAFSNEWCSIAQDHGISDTSNIYQAFISDKHLNVSEKYLRPGGPFGGPCLPKDISEFCELANSLPAYIARAAVQSNDHWINLLASKVEEELLELDVEKFGFDTYEFKQGTQDIRYSPLAKIVSILEKRGFLQDDTVGVIFCGRSLLDNGCIVPSKMRGDLARDAI